MRLSTRRGVLAAGKERHILADDLGGAVELDAIAPSLRVHQLPKPIRDTPCDPAQRDQPLSILLFLHSCEPGGVERIAFRLASAWRDAGCDVHIAMGLLNGPLSIEQPLDVTTPLARPSRLATPVE